MLQTQTVWNCNEWLCDKAKRIELLRVYPSHAQKKVRKKWVSTNYPTKKMLLLLQTSLGCHTLSVYNASINIYRRVLLFSKIRLQLKGLSSPLKTIRVSVTCNRIFCFRKYPKLASAVSQFLKAHIMSSYIQLKNCHRKVAEQGG